MNRFDKTVSQTDDEFINEYVEDFKRSSKLLEDVGACVGVFGSSRFDENNYYYKEGVKLANKLSKEGFHIVTGGSYGIMEAGNRGAYEAKGSHSIGFNLHLPFEQEPNRYTTIQDTLHTFEVRKHMLLKNTTSCVVLPGGFGTLDELFEVITLVVTNKALPISVHLVGYNFWQPLLEFIKTTLVEYDTISPESIELFHISDNLDEVVSKVKDNIKTYMDSMVEASLENTKRYTLIKEQFKNLV